MKFNFKKYELENLINTYNKYIFSYEIQLYILNNIKLLTKKDGTAYTNFIKTFDVEALKPQLEKKYNCKMGAGSCVYIVETDYNYEIHFNINNNCACSDSILYITKRFYMDELSKEKADTIPSDRIYGGGFIRKYYNIYSIEELESVINTQKENIKNIINKYKLKIKNLKPLKNYINKFIENLNKLQTGDADYYWDEISKLIY